MAHLLRRLRAECPRSRAGEPVGISWVDVVIALDRLDRQLAIAEEAANALADISLARRFVAAVGEAKVSWAALEEIAVIESRVRLELEEAA